MVRTGIQAAVQQPSTYGRNDSGNFEVWVFEGPPLQIANAAAYFANLSGLNYTVQQGFGKWRLEVLFPWNADGLVLPATDIIVRWELYAQNAEKDLLNTLDNAGIIATLSAYQKTQIRGYALTPPAQGTVLTAANFTAPDNSDAGSANNALLIYELYAAGETSYLMEAPALRRTISTSSMYTIGYSIAYSRRIMKTATVMSYEEVPNALLFNLNSLLGSDVSSDPKLNYGWYKKFPTVQQTAWNKWQIVQDWLYGWWSVPYGQPI